MVKGVRPLPNNVIAQTEIKSGQLAYPFNEVLESKNLFYLVRHDAQVEVDKISTFPQWILVFSATEQETLRFCYSVL